VPSSSESLIVSVKGFSAFTALWLEEDGDADDEDDEDDDDDDDDDHDDDDDDDELDDDAAG
jgi:hypothetical protein